jgi:ubiquitin-protein ligase
MEIVAAINHHVAQSIEESMNILLQADWKPVQTIQDILDIMLCLLYQNESRESA